MAPTPATRCAGATPPTSAAPASGSSPSWNGAASTSTPTSTSASRSRRTGPGRATSPRPRSTSPPAGTSSAGGPSPTPSRSPRTTHAPTSSAPSTPTSGDEFAARLAAEGLDELVPLIDTNLFGMSVDVRLSEADHADLARLIELGQPMSVFIAAGPGRRRPERAVTTAGAGTVERSGTPAADRGSPSLRAVSSSSPSSASSSSRCCASAPACPGPSWRASWQLLDVSVLQDDPLRGVWYLHTQPPLFNLVVGLLAWSPLPLAGALFVLDVGALLVVGVRPAGPARALGRPGRRGDDRRGRRRRQPGPAEHDPHRRLRGARRRVGRRPGVDDRPPHGGADRPPARGRRRDRPRARADARPVPPAVAGRSCWPSCSWPGARRAASSRSPRRCPSC